MAACFDTVSLACGEFWEGREEKCGKKMLDVCCVPTSHDEYITIVKTGNECQLSAYMLLLGKCAVVVCCAEVLFQPSFLLVVCVLHAEWSTERTTEPDTAQTERVLTRLVDTASLHTIHVSSLLHPVLHAQLLVVLGFKFRAKNQIMLMMTSVNSLVLN